MADFNCSACEELKKESPELIANGFTDEMCISLQNDTGLVASSRHDDCTDLNNMNDCLIGNMETEIDRYDVCNWKDYMRKYVGNAWTLGKSIICAICGLWTNIHDVWSKIAEILADLLGIHKDITTINGNITTINNNISNINSQIATMPKDFIFASVSKSQTIESGYPGESTNRVNIPCGRSDGYVPMGVVGWNLSNSGSSTGVSRIYPFKVDLMGNEVSLQLHNGNDGSNKVLVEATVIYMKK